MVDLLNSEQAAKLVGGLPRLTRLIKTGRLAFIHVGRGENLTSKRFTLDDINLALKEASEPKIPTVYVAGFGAYVKIGFTTDLPGRMIDLQENLPAELIVYAHFPGAIADERRLHAKFASCRTRGEWFLKRGKLKSWINAGCPA